MLNALTSVHWANSRITEKESNVKNKENGTDGALFTRISKNNSFGICHKNRFACRFGGKASLEINCISFCLVCSIYRFDPRFAHMSTRKKLARPPRPTLRGDVRKLRTAEWVVSAERVGLLDQVDGSDDIVSRINWHRTKTKALRGRRVEHRKQLPMQAQLSYFFLTAECEQNSRIFQRHSKSPSVTLPLHCLFKPEHLSV